MSETDKTGSFFWSTLEHILRPKDKNEQTESLPKQSSSRTSLQNSTEFNSENTSDEIYKRLTLLKQTESFETRLKSFEDLIRLSELFYLNEALINNILKLTSDLFKIEQTPLEVRTKAFEYLIQFYQKKIDKFDTFMLRNHLLCFIIINSKSSKCIFLNSLNQIKQSPTKHDSTEQINSILNNLNQNRSSGIIKTFNDDIKLRFQLFILVTKNGNYCKNLDPDLMSECLIYFLENSEHLNEKCLEIFELFKNIITNKFFQYINENLLTLLTRYMLNFSYLITNSVCSTFSNETLKQLSRQQQQDIKLCVELIDKIIENITTTVCINYVVLCLCELLDITWQNHVNRSDIQVNRIDSQMLDISDSTITQIYECMNKLFVSPIGNCAIFTFFSEIFAINKKFQVHRRHQINGALMHIKQIFDDFKQSKLKNSYLIKELHLNCLIYLPQALKSCCSDGPKDQQLIMFELILNLTIDLVNLAIHKDLFMCLLTYKSRKFLIEIVNQFSIQILENESLIKKYADLLNLLDSKDVFSYKTSNKETSTSQSLLRNASSASLNKENIDESTLIFQKFKESFYDLVYKFPRANYLKDNCINNCVDFYLRKHLPVYGSQSIEGIKTLLEKYLGVKSQFNINVRKFVIDELHKKIKEYYNMDQKSFVEQLIKEVLLSMYEYVLIEDDANYRNLANNVDKSSYVSDLFEMKFFIVSKLIELIHICHDEENVVKIIKLFEKLIGMERVSSVELLVPHNLIISNNASPNTTINTQPTQLLLIHTNNNIHSNCLNYLYKIINNGLIDVFEKHFHNTNKTFTLCCIDIFNILVKYLDYFYLTQYNFNLNSYITLTGKPSSLSSIAAESLPVQNQIQAQSNSKFFNYYSYIRKEIFEFLLRIRSSAKGKVLLIDRINRRKFRESKFLMLNLCETKLMENADQDLKDLRKCELDFGKILKLIEFCLDKEIDWNVITRVLAELPYVMQYEMDLIKSSDFTDKLFNLLYKKEISIIRNKPENLGKQDYISKFYPLIASLILYHRILEKNSQENILQNLALGIHSGRSLFCLEILTIAMTEMHETNSSQCGDILLKLSQFSSSLTMAQPILELLSTLSDFKKLHSICGIKEFIAVSATAIKYIDPFKFNPFIVLFAHYVLCIWFIKCKPEFRKSYASFTSRGLYQEVIVQLEKTIVRDHKSPNKIESESQNLKRLSSIDPLQKSDSLKSVSNSEPSLTSKSPLSENLKQFYRDLVEITMDFMSNNMNNDSSENNQTSSLHNRGEFIVDRFPNIGTLIGPNQSSLFENKEQKSCKQSKLWLIGNKIIQITTGLFSNICNEDPVNLISRKNRSSKSSVASKSKLLHSQAIDIPSQTQTDSVASSNNSSTSQSVNNSFSSMNSNFVESKKSEVKSERDFFEETIDGVDEGLKTLIHQSSVDETKSIRSDFDYEMSRRNRLAKRRYKSGIPLSNERNDDDSVEESYLKNFSENVNQKVSKDDSALNLDTELAPPFCCLKNPRPHHHHHHHRQQVDGDVKELCNPNCWCNNLVEIKCRYPTKVISFVSLIEPNFSNSHLVNLSSFEKFVKVNPFQLNFKNDESDVMKDFGKTKQNTPFVSNQSSAIEIRKLSSLSRISESSVTPPLTTEKSELEKIPETIDQKFFDIKLDPLLEKRLNTPRKSSLDLNLSNDGSDQKLFFSTNNFMRSSSVIQKAPTINQQNNFMNQILDPSQVFLHLFQNQHYFTNEKDQPTLVPDTDSIKRSLDILDYYSCFWLHKIGVVYVGLNQAYDEKSILSNSSGSTRYRNFVNGLGNLIYLRDMDTNQFYQGGLDTDGTAGDFAVLWYDGIIQILFHVATMMTTEENTNSKKRHIGNDSTIIVYNESGEEYNFSMIKGEVNCVCIEIIPLKSNTNIVRVKTTNEMSHLLVHSSPKFVSDQNLSLIVRKMALHADMASRVYRSQKDSVNGNIYGGRFYDRLKQINRIKKLTKDSQKPNTQQVKTGTDAKTNISIGDKPAGQLDFLDYI